MTKSAATFIVGCVLSMLCTELLAQFPGGGLPRRGSRCGQTENMERGKKRQDQAARENPADLIAYRLDLFHEDLRLSEEQEAAWQPYAKKVNALASDIAREQARREATSELGALQSVDHAVEVARNRLTALEEIASAARTLYDALSPAQRTLADARVGTILAVINGDDSGPPAAAGRRKRPP